MFSKAETFKGTLVIENTHGRRGIIFQEEVPVCRVDFHDASGARCATTIFFENNRDYEVLSGAKPNGRSVTGRPQAEIAVDYTRKENYGGRDTIKVTLPETGEKITFKGFAPGNGW